MSSPTQLEHQTDRFRIGDMDCPSCVKKIETRLRTLDGVVDVMGSPVSRTLTVRHRGAVNTGRLAHEIGRLGYAAHPLGSQGDTAPMPPTFSTPAARRTYGAVGLFLFGLIARAAGLDAVVGSTPLHTFTATDLVFLAAAVVGGLNFFDKGARALRAGALDMNFLMTVAIVGAAVIGETMEAAAIAFLFSVAELLERYSVDRAHASVESLMALAPETARLLRDGEEVVVPAGDLRPGDRVVVRPGERIPGDGAVAAGASSVDQAPITGESVPVDKQVGDPVFAGTINHEGALEVVIEREAGRSTLARIVQLVEEAEANKSPTEQFVERFARWYTPAVTLAAVLIVIVPPLAFGAPFLTWFVRGLTLLVIACPCALVISTPVAVVSGVTAAARNGVLIKGGVHLEAMGSVRAITFDKTGTLTVGHPRVVDVRPVTGVGSDDLLARAASIESRSGHPIARAVVDAANDRGLTLPRARDHRSLTGAGAEARIGGVTARVVKPSALGQPAEPPSELHAAGRTIVALESGGILEGWIAVSDRPRDGADDTVRALREEGIEAIVMLTGDHVRTAEVVGAAVGVDQVRAELLPADKVAEIKRLMEEWGSVAMVGDGVNDAPALATATVGIAMGAAGSDTALETADIALMGDDLSRLPYLVHLSRRARTVIRQNVAAALVVKAILAVGVPLGMVSLVAAVVIGDLGLSLAVIANALRLGRVAPPESRVSGAPGGPLRRGQLASSFPR